jgi:hypothetical protein
LLSIYWLIIFYVDFVQKVFYSSQIIIFWHWSLWNVWGWGFHIELWIVGGTLMFAFFLICSIFALLVQRWVLICSTLFKLNSFGKFATKLLSKFSYLSSTVYVLHIPCIHSCRSIWHMMKNSVGNAFFVESEDCFIILQF